MTKMLEFFFDLLLQALSFFSNLAASRHDDPLIAEYKRRQRECVAATAIVGIVAVLTFVLAHLFDALAERDHLIAVVNGLRETVGYVWMWLLLGAGSYAAYAYYALWRFVHHEGTYP